MDSFSENQNKALALLPIVPSILSLLGSSSIAYRAIAKQKKQSPYNRILLGLSCADILGSLLLPFQHFLVDKDDKDFVWAVGNRATCTAIGFIGQLFFAALFYNGVLSLYYLSTVRFGMTKERFARRLEPFLHLLAIGYPLITAVVGLALDLYETSETGVSCWVTGETAMWFYGGLPLLVSMTFIILSNIVIFYFVRNTMMRTRGKSMNQDSDARRIRAVAIQAFFYVGGFLLSYLWAFLMGLSKIYTDDGMSGSYGLFVMNALFFPLQGFWNALIFNRSRHEKYRSSFDDESRFKAIIWAVFGDENVPAAKRQEAFPPTVNTNTDVAAPRTMGSSHPNQTVSSDSVPES